MEIPYLLFRVFSLFLPNKHLQGGFSSDSNNMDPLSLYPTFTAEAPPIAKIHQFGEISVTLEPVMRFGCPSGFRIS